MDQSGDGPGKKTIYKVVLTGGPCGGKTTSLATITNFFQSLGWKVYRVTELAYIFLGGGLVFAELDPKSVYEFQKNLIYAMMQVEKTFDDLAKAHSNDKVMIVCDRAVMDSTAYMKDGQWDQVKREEGWNETELRDRRYNQVIHLVSAAKGAQDFYTTGASTTRVETPEFAAEIDDLVANAWVGHPYYDVVDNSTNFEDKLKRMLQCICARIGIDVEDRLALKSKKLNFLISKVDWEHESLQSVKVHKFEVENRFLAGSISCSEHSRIRSRRSADQDCTFVHTTRTKDQASGQVVESKRSLTKQTYRLLMHNQVSSDHVPLYKTRYSFIWQDQYFQLDVFDSARCPANSIVRSGLTLLETFTTKEVEQLSLPPFLTVEREVSGEAQYRLFNLATADGNLAG